MCSGRLRTELGVRARGGDGEAAEGGRHGETLLAISTVSVIRGAAADERASRQEADAVAELETAETHLSEQQLERVMSELSALKVYRTCCRRQLAVHQILPSSTAAHTAAPCHWQTPAKSLYLHAAP